MLSLVTISHSRYGAVTPVSLNTHLFHVSLKGLTDKMRNDFNVMKDLAVHTRLTPEQRQREVGRLIDYIHK